jgi:MFS family permease
VRRCLEHSSALVIWKSIQGVGAALLVPGSREIIGTSFDEKRRSRAIGTWSGFTAITSIGPVFDGCLVERAICRHWNAPECTS